MGGGGGDYIFVAFRNLELYLEDKFDTRFPMQGSRIYMFIDRLCSKKDFMIRKSIFKLQQVVLELKVDFRTTPKVLFKEFYSINLY